MKRIGLVSCVKLKRDHPAPAEDLYISPYFGKMRAHVKRTCDAWRILSAKHGLLHPTQTIAPYEETLKTKSRQEQRAWAERVLSSLKNEFASPHAFEIHAGSEYARDLVPLLRAAGHSVELPLDGLSIGYRLQFYNTPDARQPSRPRLERKTIPAEPPAAMAMRPTASRGGDAFAAALDQIIADADAQGAPHVDVKAGDLHRHVGGYPGQNHRMPLCCSALRKAMTDRDTILDSPPSGKGARLTIRYVLPRHGHTHEGPS